jgi:hypothetical protein
MRFVCCWRREEPSYQASAWGWEFENRDWPVVERTDTSLTQMVVAGSIPAVGCGPRSSVVEHQDCLRLVPRPRTIQRRRW